MIIIPGKADGVFADRFGGNRLGGGFEHGQHSGSKLGGLPGPATGFIALFVAHGAGAGVAKIDKIEVGQMAILPLNVHPRAGREIHFDRLGVGGRGRRW